MSQGKMSYSYVNENGKKVNGSAATLHEIYTVNGGLQNYHDMIGKAYIERFVSANSDIINEGIKETAKRRLFKVI